MLNRTWHYLRNGIRLLILFLVTLGVIYPLAVTGFAQLLFPWKANGSLLMHEGFARGSALIGQSWSDAAYFWGRPSATKPSPYNSMASTGSNLAMSNPDFFTAVKTRIAKLRSQHRQTGLIPPDLVTASGSGLDPHISPLAALYQIPRIAKSRSLSETQLVSLVKSHTEARGMGVLGEPRVNVLQLNLALDTFGSPHDGRKTQS